MPNKRIEDLTEQELVPLEEYVAVAVDTGAGVYVSKKVKRKNLLRLTELAELTTLLPEDLLLVSTGDPPVLKKVKNSNVIRQMFMQTADGAVVAGTTEQTLIGSGVGSLTIPAGFLSEMGRGFEIEMRGTLSSLSSGAGTMTIRLKVGALTNGEKTFNLKINYDSAAWRMKIMAVRRNNGLNPALKVHGEIGIDENFVVGGGVMNTYWLQTFNNTDPTIDQTINVTAQFSVGTNPGMQSESMVVSRLIP